MRRPRDAVDFDRLEQLFPPAPEYFDTAWLADPATIEATQLERLQARAATAAKVPFFARRWADAGFDPASVSYTHLRAHETSLHLVCRLLLEKT